MLRDMGFSHAIATAVLEDNPNDPTALKILAEQPENRIVYNDGTVVDLSKTNEEAAIYEGFKRQLTRMAL